MNKTNRPFVLLGAGGHAKVVLDILKDNGLQILGVCDPDLHSKALANWRGVPVLGDDSFVKRIDPNEIFLANGIGVTKSNKIREKVYADFIKLGFVFPALIHSSAWVSPWVTFEDGVQIMAGAVIQADVTIGRNSIVNTGAKVDHDSNVGANTHIAPGVTICGNVLIGDLSFIGSNSCVLEGAVIDRSSFISANSVYYSPKNKSK